MASGSPVSGGMLAEARLGGALHARNSRGHRLSQSQSLHQDLKKHNLYLYIHTYVYIYTYMYVYIYIYMYIESERGDFWEFEPRLCWPSP